ncbi:MAG: hypothetical protein JNK29_11910, partial [Anaerolineales bacterium]|nr:hypothetical protein [Anaerolineales bacterium]
MRLSLLNLLPRTVRRLWRGRAGLMAAALSLALALAAGLLAGLAAGAPPRAAQAQGGPTGWLTQTTVTDFSQTCNLRAGTVVAEQSGSDASTGEVRLGSALEDYFFN